MEANGGGGGLEDGGDGHALANGGGGHALANGALANGEGHALANGVANGGGQAAAMEEAGGAVGNGGLQVMGVPNGVVPAQAVAALTPDALYQFFLRLPAQEIARCRMVCSLWRDIINTDAFRGEHHRYPYKPPMPLVFFQDPGFENLHAVDVRDIVPWPVMRFPNHQHEVFRIHASFAGILLLSYGDRLYACNPCTRRWAHLPPLHVHNHIIGFYATGIDDDDEHGNLFRCQVLYHDRREPNCEYWIFELGAAAQPPWSIGRPSLHEDVHLDLVLANGIAPSYTIPPVCIHVFLLWLPQAAWANSDILMFDTDALSFLLIPPPTIQVDGEDFPVGVGGQLLEIAGHLAMAVFSPERLDVWVRCNIDNLWSRRYRIPLHQDDAFTGGEVAVARDRTDLVQGPSILHAVQHGTFLSRHTIEESLLLHPAILPMQDTDAVDDDPPFFRNQ
uniref:Uncharacterized protein n=1 Tax=Avena sativa TaxID=4498 RepID=A0ACD6A2V3_AVESA